MANIKFSQFTNQPAADTTYLVGFDGTANTNYTKAQVKTWLTTGSNAIPTLYSADGILSGARTVDLSTFDLTFDGSSNGRIIYSGVGEANNYALVSSATGEASWGILQEAGGGTGITSYTEGQILYSDASDSLATLDIGTVGKVLKVTGTAPNLIPGWVDETNTTYTGGTDIGINVSNVISHDAITNTGATASSTLTAGDTFTAINSVTVSAQGHLTGQTVETYTLPGDIDTGLTSVTYAIGTGQTTPLSGVITSRALELTSNKYGGTNQIGYVPEGGTSSDFLRGDGTWVTPTDTTYSAMTTSVLGLGKLMYTTGSTPAAEAQSVTAGRTYGITENASSQLIVNVPWLNTTYSTFTGADGTSAGTEGLVPQPTATDNVKFLTGAATWAVPTDTTDNAVGAAGQLQYTNGSGVFQATSDMVYTTDQLKVQNTLYLDGNGSGAGIVKLGCEAAGASHYVGLEGPTHSGANAYIIKFPDATPTANQVLKVNTVASSTANMIWAADTNTNTNIGDTDLTLDASRTLDLSASQNLTFIGSGTSKITFSNTGGVQLDEDTTFKKNAIVEGQGYTELVTTTYSSTLALDFNDSNVQTIELTGNITLSAPLNVKLGATYILILKQGGSGGHSVTLHSSMKLPANATFVPTAAAGKADVLTMIAYSSSVLMTVATLNLATS